MHHLLVNCSPVFRYRAPGYRLLSPGWRRKDANAGSLDAQLVPPGAFMPRHFHTPVHATHGNPPVAPASANTEAVESYFPLDRPWGVGLTFKKRKPSFLASGVEPATLPPTWGCLGHLPAHTEARQCCPEGPPPRSLLAFKRARTEPAAVLSPSKKLAS